MRAKTFYLIKKKGLHMQTSSFSIHALTKMALCVAFCCVTAYISFPLPFTPGMVTALTLALGVTAFVLPPKQTFIALVIYVLMGAVGLPVFVGGTAGFGRLLGPTGGYIIAWVIAYPIISALKGKNISFKRYALVDIVVGIPLTYVGGLISMILMMDIASASDLHGCFALHPRRYHQVPCRSLSRCPCQPRHRALLKKLPHPLAEASL